MSCKIGQSELLIECVRKHATLYDTNLKEYSDAHLKTKIWEKIAKECGFSTGNQAKASWKNLRDCYRCALKTAKSGKSGDGARKIKPWKFTEQMSFLMPYMKDRPRSSNISYDDGAALQLTETQTEVPDDENDNVHEEIDGSSDKVDSNVEVYQVSETPPTSNEMNLKRKLSQQQTDERDTPKMKKLAKTKDSLLEFLKEQAEKREKRSEARQRQRDMLLHSSHNSLKLFFDSMYEATIILPLEQQRQVRRALFNAVSAAEEAADNQSIARSTPTPCSYVPQPNTMISANYMTPTFNEPQANFMVDND